MSESPRASRGVEVGPPPVWMRWLFFGLSRLLQRMDRRRFGPVDTAAAIYVVCRPRHIRDIAQRHRRANPRLDEDAARLLARRSVREYWRTCLDFMWAHELRAAVARRRGEVVGLEKVRRLQADNRGAVLALAHHGNWDAAATLALANHVPLATVMQPLGDGSINSMAVWARQQRGLEVHFTGEHATGALVDALRRGRFVALLADLPQSGRTTAVDFRGHRIAFSEGPALLALRARAPILPVTCIRRPDGGYRVVVAEPMAVQRGDDIAAVTRRLAAALDRLAAMAPDQWYPINPFHPVAEVQAGDQGRPQPRRPASAPRRRPTRDSSPRRSSSSRSAST